jgi:hypothetical protein
VPGGYRQTFESLRGFPARGGHESLPNATRNLDHIVVFGEGHLRRILFAYADYCNEVRAHLLMDKEPPDHRPVQRHGQLAAWPIPGGLHHEYCRM